MITVTRPVLPPLEEYVEYLKAIWEARWLTNDGRLVQKLGEKLERYLKIKNLVLVSNGTLAIELAFKAFGVEGEVITTPFTFSATTNVLLWLGLKPVFADIDPETYNIDPEAVEEGITEKTRAILAVHVYGNPCNIEKLERIARKHDLKLVYDAAHAFGVEYKDQSVLHYGDASTLSFHATKVFNTIEGGGIVAKDLAIFEKLKLLRNHGIRSEEVVELPGTNAKMNEFQAAMGLCLLKDVDGHIQARRKLYERYKKLLAEIEGLGFQRLTASRYNFSYMPVRFRSKRERDRVFVRLGEKDVKPRKYFYPLSVDFDYFKGRKAPKGKDEVKVARGVADRILCLPLYPDLLLSEVDWICGMVKDACA